MYNGMPQSTHHNFTTHNQNGVKFNQSQFTNPNDIFAQFFGTNPFESSDKNRFNSNLQNSFSTTTKQSIYTNKLKSGSNIIIKELIDKSELNGTKGKIVNYDKSKNRYMVKLATEIIISLKPNNIVPMISKIKIANITSNSDLNGKTGNITGWNAYTKRFNVKLFVGYTISVKPNNIIWPTSTLIYIDNLINASQYNGKSGRITNYDGCRYSVKIGANHKSILKLKPDNISIIC